VRVRSPTPAPVYIDQALAILDQLPARQLRATVLRVMAEAAVNNGEPALAVARLRSMAEILRGLGNDAGVGTALTETAQIQLRQREFEAARASANEAARLLEPPHPLYRWVVAQSLLVDAMTGLHDPALRAQADRLRAANQSVLTLRERARVALSLSRAEAAMKHPEVAYRDLERHVALEAEIDAKERARDLQQLAARYEARAQAAEIRELRLKESATALELQARDARQRAMAATIAALALGCAVAGIFGWRMLLARRRVAELAARDELTGRPNRRAILAYAEQQLALAERLDLPFSLAIIDIDHFKRVNDTYGHPTGDALLKAFATCVAGVMRAPDLLGRYGGEEWLLVMPGTQSAQIPAVFDRIRAPFLAQSIEGLPLPHRVSFSMGAASLVHGEDTLATIIARADRCLYEAKQAGRDSLRVAAAKPTAAAV
jgi:diguanylate cyclase (GGDEF)-like protein